MLIVIIFRVNLEESFTNSLKENNSLSELENTTAPDWSTVYESSDSWSLTREQCIYIYSGLIVINICLTLTKLIVFFNMCINASVNLHDQMFK